MKESGDGGERRAADVTPPLARTSPDGNRPLPAVICAVCGIPVEWDWQSTSLKRPLCGQCYYERALVPYGTTSSAEAAWDKAHPTVYGKETERRNTSMPLTKDQALAFVSTLVGSPKMKSHLEAHLGLDNVPSAADFISSNSKAVDKCGELLGHLGDVGGVLHGLHRARPRQKELDFKGKKGRPPGGQPVAPPAEKTEEALEKTPRLVKDGEPKARRGRPAGRKLKSLRWPKRTQKPGRRRKPVQDDAPSASDVDAANEELAEAEGEA
jgi:hypothetical protein